MPNKYTRALTNVLYWKCFCWVKRAFGSTVSQLSPGRAGELSKRGKVCVYRLKREYDSTRIGARISTSEKIIGKNSRGVVDYVWCSNVTSAPNTNDFATGIVKVMFVALMVGGGGVKHLIHTLSSTNVRLCGIYMRNFSSLRALLNNISSDIISKFQLR